MARTRATKGRPRPPSRNKIARIDTKRGSTVESLRASITSIELDESEVERTPVPQTKRQTPNATGCLRCMSDEEENIVNIKQEEDDMAVVAKVATRPKRCTQEPISKASATKKHKPSLPSSTTHTTRSRTLISRTKPDSIHSDTGTNTDNESEHDFNPGHSTIANTLSHQKNARVPLINPSLDLLRPYMAFQLSVSRLSGKAYKAAQAHMASVLDVAECLEKRGSGVLARAHNSLDSSSSSSDEYDIQMDRAKGAAGKEKKVEKLAKRTEEDVLPRKQRELDEQARKRLEQEMRKGRGWQGQGGDRDSTTHPSSISTSSSDAETEIASDTEDEAKYPPEKLLSVSSTTSSYHSLHGSTDSAETSSEGEESDVIERRERNALRRQKARQKRRNACKRVEHDSESGSEMEMEMDVVRQRESERRTTMLVTRELGREVMIDFLPVAW